MLIRYVDKIVMLVFLSLFIPAVCLYVYFNYIQQDLVNFILEDIWPDK
jgi:hypothetical protein